MGCCNASTVARGVNEAVNAVPLDIEDEAQLVDYLRATDRIGRDEEPVVRILTGGVSNRAVFVERQAASFVVKQALEKLRVAVDWYSDPNRIFREAAALRILGKLLPTRSVPTFLFEDSNVRLFAMSAVPTSAENWKTMLLAGRVEPLLVRQFGTLLGTMHRMAYERDSDLRISEAFGDRSLFESLRVEPYYAYSAEREPEARAFLSELINDVRSHALTFVHGDYSPKNVLVEHGQMVLLDFEVAHWGDPAFDVGFALTHLLSKAHHVAGSRSAFAAAAQTMWGSYWNEIAGLPWCGALEARVVRHTVACLLARVSGRSPLEYLSVTERLAQRAAAMGLMHTLPSRVDDLVRTFLEAI